MPIGTPVTLGSAVTTGNPSTLTLTTAANIVTGDLVVVATGCRSNAQRSVASVSDGTNTYTQAGTINDGANVFDIWYKENATAVLAGGTITATLNAAITGGGNGGVVQAYRVTGIAASSSLDKVATQAATTSTPSVASGTLTQASELAVGAASQWAATPTYTESSGFTAVNSATSASLLSTDMSYQIVAATTTVTFAPSWSGSGQCLTLIATFKAAATAWQGTSSLNGVGSLSATSQLAKQASATLAGAGSLAASASIGLIAAASFAGAGSLTANGEAAKLIGAQFAGVGSLSATVLAVLQVSAAFNGSGSLSASLIATLLGAANFNGTGHLSASLSQSYTTNPVEFDGTGGLSATAVRYIPSGPILFNGVGNLNVNAMRFEFVLAYFNGSSTLTVNTFIPSAGFFRSFIFT